MEIYTKHLHLKPITMNELNDVFVNFNHEITTYMYPKPADHIDETRAFITTSIRKYEEKVDIVFAARLKDTHEFIGCMGLHHIDTRTPELGLWIKKEAFGSHYGLEGITGIIAYAKEHLTYDYLIYPVDYDNIPSRNIPETLGGIAHHKEEKENMQGNILHIVEYHIYDQFPYENEKPILLFQGDSITDWNRRRDVFEDLGGGYVNILAHKITQGVFLNRGISGNRTIDLFNRWKEDTLDLNPDFLSILIGINEVWHFFQSGKYYTTEMYRTYYESILKQVKETHPKTKILLIEPFVLETGVYEPSWMERLIEEQEVVKELANTYADYYLPMQSIMNNLMKTYRPEEILSDGVHPTELGFEIMAKHIGRIVKNYLIEYWIDVQKKPE